jgi:hypothetical protein
LISKSVHVLFITGLLIGVPVPELPSEPDQAMEAPAGTVIRFIVGVEDVPIVGPAQVE